MKPQESAEQAALRWDRLHILQREYANFIPFLEEVMFELGFETTDVQREIAGFMEFGPQYLMVQAQRGQAKTTVAAAFAVWCLMHSPAHRVLVLSAGGNQASDIATLIVRLIMTMDILECMRPDKMAGDRTSTEKFDIHHSLKGTDKSASVECHGIDSNLQGLRADLILADDVESGKNSATQVQRAKLLHITKDFTSINSTGRIIWLGTPQTLESIYNSLESRGVTIRIWPGRYPTETQVAFYGNRLAPGILQRLKANPRLGSGGGLLGDQGQPMDPVILDEEKLQAKELDQGQAYFQLQHMLNTTLSDAMRYPLKPSLLTIMRAAGLRWPLQIIRGMLDTAVRHFNIATHAFTMMAPHEVSPETGTLESIWAYVDPAAGGANGDETAWAIGGILSGNIVLLSAGGIPGGYTLDKMEYLAKLMKKWNVGGVTIEKNMGFGAFREVWLPILRQHHQCDVQDDLVTGQKEARIIATLSPVMGRGALIISEEVIDEDRDTISRYNPSMQQSYSLFYQLAKMTSARQALVHDDRADALEGLVRHFQAALARDQEKILKANKDRAWKESIKDPCGHNRYKTVPTGYGTQRPSMLKRRR